MEESSPDTKTERTARGRALLARLQATQEKLEGMIPQKKAFSEHKPTVPNDASISEWQMFHFTSQLINWFRVSAILIAMAILVLLWGNLQVSNRKLAYVAVPGAITNSAQDELGSNINQSAKLDDLRLFLSTVLPRLKEVHFQQSTDMTPLQGLVNPEILNAEMRYRRGVEQATRLNKIVLSLTVNARSIENYVYNKKEGRFSFSLKGNYRVSAGKEGGDVIRDIPFSARAVMEEVPLSAANPFGFFLLKLEENK